MTAPPSPAATEPAPAIAERPRLAVPLNALRAFEAAARHLSIKAAASEIGVTPSAVSHQLRALEEALGVELLRRAGAALELTEAGRALAPELSAGFGRIVTAVGALRTERRLGPLRLSLLPTFLAHWLSPRLAGYPFARSGFELLLSTTQLPVDLNAGVADAAVRYGAGTWPGLTADLLFAEHVTLLAAPAWCAAHARDLKAGIARAPLFLSQHRRENLERWNASLPGGPVTPAAVVPVDSAGVGLKAALDGAGLTLAGLEVAASDIAAGRLAPVFAHSIASGGGYYLVYPQALARDRRIRNLRTWLFAEAARDPPA